MANQPKPLPRSFYTALGRYCQSCAMIERNIWRLLQLVLALDPKVEADSLKIAEMRKMRCD